MLESEDPLTCGPAPATNDLIDWRSIRSRFIRSMYLNWPEFSFEEFADNGLLMNAERFRDADGVVVWCGLGLPDQLLLAWVVRLFDTFAADVSKICLVQFERLNSKHNILGVGELSPEIIRNSSPEARSLKGIEVDELRQVWNVYTSVDPVDLSMYVGSISSLPTVHRAISCLINRYPDVRSGLGVVDESLLHYTGAQGPKAARVIGYTMAYNESLDWVGDMELFRRLVRMSDMRSPLIFLTGNRNDMRQCEVHLTSLGESVLARRVNNVHENGIDDWIGGVHLNDREPVTFRSGSTLDLP